MVEQQDTTPEEFRKIAAFPDYSVSNLGRVRRETAGKFGAKPGKILKGCPTGAGYLTVNLFFLGRASRAYVHHLVSDAFLEKIPGRSERNHIDGKKANNRADNLEWCTHAENQKHAGKKGLMATGNRNGSRTKPERLPRGESHCHAKLTGRDIVLIRAFLSCGIGQSKIASVFGVSQTSVSHILLGKACAHVK